MAGEACTFDVVVVGSGAAGLTAAATAVALGRTVAVLEAGALLGGSTAYSEGMIWVPGNEQAEASASRPGHDQAEAYDYLTACSGNHIDADRAAAYVEGAAEMLSAVEAATALRFRLNRQSIDYYPDKPGASRGARALNPEPFDARAMPRGLFAKIRPPLETMMLFGGLVIASRDLPDYLRAGRKPAATLRVLGHVLRFGLDRLRGWPRGTRLANGNAIVAALAQAVAKGGGRIETDAPVKALVVEGGRVVGVRTPDAVFKAGHGVLLAVGGFTAAPAASRRTAALGANHVSIPPSSAEPGAIELAAPLGAAVRDEVSQPALWAPTSLVPSRRGGSTPWPHFGDRAKPGVIAVGPDGRRFANEASLYHDFVPAMIANGAAADGGDPHAWIIADHRALRRYGLGAVGPFPVPLGRFLRSGYLRRGATMQALALRIGVDPAALEDALARFNRDAANGRDTEFGRGASVYDRSNGDPENRPNPSLRPLDRPPFYAIRMVPGDIGGFVGLRTDARARVLREDGGAIPGLYAAGNAAAVVTGGSYPAAGVTIGSAMTFGYLAVRDMASADERADLRSAAE